MHSPKQVALAFIAALSLLLCSCSKSGDVTTSLSPVSPFTSAKAVTSVGEVTEEVRGVWIASVFNINFPSAPDLSENQLKRELDDIVSTAISYGLNTLYFQVHPAADALYQSDIFPVSQFLFTDGVLHFDPLEYMTRLCAENDISLFAWVNPLRASVSTAESKSAALAALPQGSPAADGELTVFYGDGKLYFNCGIQSVRQLVADAVAELCENYDIDGVVFDDYFYPYPVSDEQGNTYPFDDSDAYSASATELSLDDWRRDNVNQLIALCYSSIKSSCPEKQFGVAPFGIWQNNDGTNSGSDTSGMEAYSALYCDAAAWISERCIDFISPQLYWECDSSAASFAELADFWSVLTDGTGVKLIISHGLYRYENDWSSPEGELVRQTELARKLISYRGSMLYGYAALKKNACGAADDTAEAFANEVYYYSPSKYPDEITLFPEENTETGSMEITFSGYSDPYEPLSVNGSPISRGHGGYFKCKLSLQSGENEFVFTCGKLQKTVTVIKNSFSDG